MKIRTILVLSSFTSILACNGLNQQSSSTATGTLNSFPDTTMTSNNLRVSLTDAPSKELKSVFVNVDRAELFVKKGANKGRLIIAQDLGLVDLMTLRNGVLLPLEDLNLGTGVEITAIRLVLKGDNNHAIKSDDSRCEMQTPSGQQSGIKIHLAQPFILESNHVYSMVMDFDAEKSVVVKGTGDCLLKPVLKLLQVTRVPADAAPAGGGSIEDSEPSLEEEETITLPENVTDGSDSNTGINPESGTSSSGEDWFEIPMDPVDEPAVVSEAEIQAL